MPTVVNKGLPPMRRVVLPPVELAGLPPPPDAPTLTDTAAADPAAQVQVGTSQPYTSTYDPATDLDAEARRRVLMSVQPQGTVADPMQDPGFRAFLAKRMQDVAELKAAQGRAADARGSLPFKIGTGLMAFGGAGAGELAQRYAQAGQPVADVLQRQEAERAGTKGAQEEAGLAGEFFKNRQAAEAATPASAMSKARAMLALHQGLIGPEDLGTFSASMEDALMKGATVQVAMKHAQAQIEQSRAALAETHAAHEETARHHLAMEGKGRQLDAGQIKQLADIDAAEKQATAYIAELEELNKNTYGSVTRSIEKHIPFTSTEAKKAEARGGIVSKLIARGIEGNRLSDKDMAYYEDRVIPLVSDPVEVQRKKAESLRAMFTDARNAIVGNAAAAGRNVGNLGGGGAPSGSSPAYATPSGKVAPPMPTGTPVRAPSDADLAAVDWLQQNPNHPDAPGVRARLAAKGIQ